MSLRELSGVLWRERQLLDLLQYKLETERLISEDSSPWLDQATREVRTVVERLRLTEVERATHSSQAARTLHLSTSATLAQLAAAAPGPWSGILDRHRAALRQAVAEADEAAHLSRVRLELALADTDAELDLRRAEAPDRAEPS